ncbi:MAG TPA: hypothetical protein VI139_01290, partial [Gemmatimonadales bacterium]
MRVATLLGAALLAALACRRVAEPGRMAGAEAAAAIPPRDSADSALRTPRVVSEPTVVVFWLPAGDTLEANDAAAFYDEMTTATAAVADTLKRNDIALVPTSAETLYIALPNHKRRMILLSGLDYPFGYVLLDPGGVERIL